MLLHLPRMDGFGTTPNVKNGPPLAGHGAAAVRDAITAQIGTLPEQLRRSLTWDQGGELAQHVQLKIDAGIDGLLLRPPLARGSGPATRTPTACCGSTSPRAPTCPAGPDVSSTPSSPPSTPDPARASAGAHPPRSTSNSYPHHHRPVLHRPPEPAQYTSKDYAKPARSTRQ